MKLVTFFFLVCSTITTSFAIDLDRSVTSEGRTRTFKIHAPGAAIAQNLPVMLVLHGDGGTGAGIKSYTGFDAVADAQNFMVVYPDAINGLWNNYVDDAPGHAGRPDPNAPNDVLFISDLIDNLCTNYGIDNRKVYVTGHSGGGFMTYALALLLPEKIAAFAPVAGSLWGESNFVTQKFSTNYTKVPIYHLHGDADNVVNYPDADHMPVAWEEWPLSGFSNANCGTTTYGSTTTVVTGIEQKEFCNSDKIVRLIRVVGGGHGWPNVNGYNPALSIWNFAKNYQLTTNTSCQVTAVEPYSNPKLLIYPNPTSDFFTLQMPQPHSEAYQLKLSDLSGKCIQQHIYSHNEPIQIHHLEKGIYVLEVYDSITQQRVVERLIVE